MQQSPLQSTLTTASADHHYASISSKHHSSQVLCSDPEGWGPISEIRWDLTPCFLDVWVLFVAAFGLIGGVGALFYLFKRKPPQDVKKNWHYYTKM